MGTNLSFSHTMYSKLAMIAFAALLVGTASAGKPDPRDYIDEKPSEPELFSEQEVSQAEHPSVEEKAALESLALKALAAFEAAQPVVDAANTKLDEAQAALDEGWIVNQGMPGRTLTGQVTFKEAKAALKDAQAAVHAANRRLDELRLALERAQ